MTEFPHLYPGAGKIAALSAEVFAAPCEASVLLVAQASAVVAVRDWSQGHRLPTHRTRARSCRGNARRSAAGVRRKRILKRDIHGDCGAEA